MKNITFPAYCRFGKLNSGETWVDVELTDEEAERIITLGTQPDIYYKGFQSCEELKDLYDRIYTIAVDQMSEEMRDFGELDKRFASNHELKVDDLYACGVNFPFEFEDLLCEE
jgi:hypothetical protein